MQPLETDGNLSVPLKPLLAERLPWLFEDLGFRVAYSDYDPAHFGDSMVILNAERIRLRFVRDRGQVMLDVATRAEPEEWFSFGCLYEAIHNESIKPRFTLNALGDLLKKEFAALVDGLGPNLSETRKEIERRENERLRAIGVRHKLGTPI
jgi:hypothetical protein